MNNRVKFTTITLLLICQTAFAQNVEWINGMDKVVPPAWAITPANPADTDTISFEGPTDQSYGNDCVAQGALGGTPYLSISNLSKTVELRFQGPAPEACYMIYMPTVGLTGEFGPLTPGDWTFQCRNPKIAFQIDFTVSGDGQDNNDGPAPPTDSSHWSWGNLTFSEMPGLYSGRSIDDMANLSSLSLFDTGSLLSQHPLFSIIKNRLGNNLFPAYGLTW